MNIYIVFVLGFILSWIAKSRNKRIYTVFIIILLGLFVGFRNRSIGADTSTYYSMFSYLRHGVFSPNYEYGFSLISYIILRLFNGDTRAPFVIYGLITNALLISRLWKLRKDFDFSLSVLLYMIFLYPSSCNLMRQYLSLAIVFWSLKYLDNKQIVRFCISVVLATTIHISAAICIIYIYIYIGQALYEDVNKKRNEIIIGLITLPVIAYVGYYVFRNYSSYFEVRNNSIGLFNVFRIVFLFISIYFSKSLFAKDDQEYDDGTLYAYNRIVVISYLIGVTLYFLGYLKTTIMRIGLYFGICEVQYISLVCRKGRGKQIASLMYVIMTLYYFTVNSISGWSGLAQYSTFFVQ